MIFVLLHDGTVKYIIQIYFVLTGQCACHEMTSSPIYTKPGHSTAVVEWPIPQFTCKAGRKASVEHMIVTPQLNSPHAFSIGEHIIDYTFKLKGGVSVSCPVTITVKGECRPQGGTEFLEYICIAFANVLKDHLTT